MEDVKIQDREELKRIMKGDFQRRNHGESIMEEMEEDEKLRLKRMEEFELYMKKKEAEDGKDLYLNDENMSSNKNE
jgi:beta-xylosidase